MLYLTISLCYGSKKILWIQSVLGLLGLGGGGSWILVDQSDIWIPKCTEGRGGPSVKEIFLKKNTIFFTPSLYSATIQDNHDLGGGL